MEEEPSPVLDEALYNRQLYVLGHDAMQKMSQARVLVAGLGALGVEVAKNLALMGVRAISLHDPTPAQWGDLAGNFYLREAELGKPRAAACVARLGQLNPHVRVTVVDGALDAAAVAGHDVLVCTQAPTARQLELNAICRAHGVKFLAAGIHGVFSRVFADFGDEHAVTDADGEPPAVSMVASVSADSPPLVTVTDQARHGLQTGSKVVFTEVQGMDRLTSGEVFEVEEKGPFTFTLKGVEGASLGAYGSGGYVKEVKEGKVMRFRALEEAIRQPGEFLESDFGKFGRPLLLHIAFLALDRWSGDNGGKLPHSGSRADADAVAAAAAALNGERQREGLPCVEAWGDAENAIARWLALTARGEISPMAAAIGGFVAQEALKGVSGKFTPLHQWFYFDEVECLPAEPLAEAEYAPRGSRYDGQAAVFGWTMQQQVLAQRYFLVGAGAIGCEMLKNWALMGVGCGPEGQVTVTDMDRIEKSNLSRQFLFRASDIGEPKSATAAAAVREMNGDMRLRPMEQRVGTATEAVFNDDFFDALTGVCTALDNVEARMYMDQRCLFYSKPMLESGTLGTKGNTQVVVPHVTENYGASRDPPEKSIPLCTLKNFPHKIEHTIQWARDWFEGAFKQTPEDANTHLRSGEDFATLLQQQASSAVYTLERVEKALGEDRPISLEHCVQWARRQFEHLFHNIIVQLLHTFPPEHTTAEGQPFWAGEKRMPSPVSFDPSDETHVDFIEAAANLHAFNYGIRGTRDRAFLRRVAAETEVEAFQPSSGVKIAATDEEAKREAERKQQQAATGIDDTIRDKMARLPAPADMAGYQLVPAEFEKDDDGNHHMDLITAAANLRARNYRIEETDKHTAKRIAGKIIPAIATTTATVTGLVCLELYKLLQGKGLEAHRNSFLNLALPVVAMSEPLPPAKNEQGFTAWDHVDVVGPCTVKGLIDQVEAKHSVSISILSCGSAMLYSLFMPPQKQTQRLQTPVEELAVSVAKRHVDETTRFIILECCASDADDNDVDLPSIRYRIK